MENIQSVLEQAVQFGVFGTNNKYISFEYEKPAAAAVTNRENALVVTASDPEISEDFVGKIVYLNENNQTCTTKPLIVKTINEKNTHQFKHLSFLGEISQYRRIIPYLQTFLLSRNEKFSAFPKFHYGAVSSTLDNDDALNVLEYPEEFVRGPQLWDLEHVSVVLAQLGVFHSSSYNAKSKDPNVFFPQLRRLYEVNYCNMDALKDMDADTLGADLPNGSIKTMLTGKTEPISVICIGSVNPKKILFRYENGKPVCAKFVDLFGARYTSPAFDLMNVLYLHTSQQVRETHWDRCLQVYYDALSGEITDSGVYLPKLSEIQKDFKINSVISYLIGSKVLPWYFERETADQILTTIRNDIYNRFFRVQ